MIAYRILLTFQYLGFRFDGVQKNPGLKTIHSLMLERFHRAFPGRNLKMRFSSRTDKMVSSLESHCLLMIEGEGLPENAVEIFNRYLPADLKILSVHPVDTGFVLLKSVQQKNYRYYFSEGQGRGNPFASPFMTFFEEKLDIELMQKASTLFQGEKCFVNYTINEKKDEECIRKIETCRIETNTHFTASFFPQNSYFLEIEAKGFMRGQVRLIMGTLVRVGLKELTLPDVENSLKARDLSFVKFLAPASGLILTKSHINIGNPSSL